MEYKKLGDTDITVSQLALGTMTFGEQNSAAEAFAQLDYAVAQGINCIDVAEMYPVPPKPETQGMSETIVGDWLAKRGHRQQIILATKVTGSGGLNSGVAHIRGGPRLTAEQIKRAIDASLARLRTEYIDLYQLHWPERKTNFFGRLGYEHSDDDGVPLQESLSALAAAVTAGKVRYIGISNETPWGLMACCRWADSHGLPRIVSIQNPYNLLNRTFEVGLAEMAIREKISLLAYSPLAFGVLSGKYIDGQAPAGSRLALSSRFSRYQNPYAQSATAAYVALARAHHLRPCQMALAFINSRAFTTTNILGATSVQQLRDNIRSLEVTLSADVIAAIDAIHQQYSNPAP